MTPYRQVVYLYSSAAFCFSHYYLLKSCFPAEISEGTQHKFLKIKELCLARRRWDAGWERRLRHSDLCVSASLREVVLVAAEGRAGWFASFAVERQSSGVSSR
jgi:hypothetical protein